MQEYDTTEEELEELSRAELTDAVSQLREDLKEYKKFVGQQHAQMNKRIAALEEENEDLRTKVSDLEAISNPNPSSKEYNEMSRDERVRRVREALLRRAEKNHEGKAKMDYKDVLLLFDNHPSAGYAYKLMELAGQEDGFDYANKDGRRIRVVSDAVKDESLFHTVNKAHQGEPA